MRFKLDENMPVALRQDLATAGHDTQTCEDEGIAGVVDTLLAAHAHAENRILVTFDLDFSDIRRYPPGSHPGMVIFRLQSQDIATCRAACARLLQAVPEADFAGNLIVVEEKRVRIRRPQP
jgi:predicted nuclease of predicted toxin-antitoxin system